MTASTGELLAMRLGHPDRVAFVEGATGLALSWDGVGALVERWQSIPSTTRSGGCRVGLHLADPLAMAAHYLAALAAGVTVAPLNPAGTAGELVVQGVATGLSGAVTDSDDPEIRDALAGAGIEPLSADAPSWDLPARSWRLARRPGTGPAALVMTSSGTTGAPKIIPLTEVQLLHTARAVAGHLDLGPEERGYSPLPLFHINGLVVGVLAALVAGSSLVVDRRFSRSSFWSVVERERVTWLNLVPAIITLLAGAGAGDRPAPGAERVRLARSASAPLAAATRERFEVRFGVPVVETYGMTEAASQITANPVGAPRPGSVGVPVDVDVRVVDGARRAVGPGNTGGVEIRGTSVTTTYWAPGGSDAPVPRMATAGGWLPTGDIGRLDADGYLYLVGRADDVINRGGEKVQPREIEEVLLADARVSAAVVVGRPHPTVGEEPVAYVLADAGVAGRQRLAAELARRCETALSRFKRPAEIIVADTLPAGPTGKVRRSEIRRMAASADVAS
ncbi:MAG TPA: AMP-binding protein [Acidimicrobiales bacterium]|nr:AMP-binding protein [Acidimicrobiales bacterium]